MRGAEKFCDHNNGRSKICHRTLAAASVNARLLIRALTSLRQIVQSLYAYPCSHCGEWHLTRLATWDGKPHELVFEAAPEEMQRWAMRSR